MTLLPRSIVSFLGLAALPMLATSAAPNPAHPALPSSGIIRVMPKPKSPMVYSGYNSKLMAAWQKHLTLGPGDTLNLDFYGHLYSLRRDVPISPDGLLSYMQAQDVPVAGLTIDQIRHKLDIALRPYYRHARVVVMPASITSKRFCILGKVVHRGVFPMDRPVTVLEAVAMAGGLQMGQYNGNTVELADLPRAFLIRDKERVPINFPALFDHGDLSQNILLEPGDYLYFPSAEDDEIYVFGAVRLPGAEGITGGGRTVVGAISQAGGFQLGAFRSKVIVLRGSLNHPKTFVVNVNAIVHGKAKGFQLQPHDIVYVSPHAWVNAEDIADLAASAFIRTAVNVWAANNVGSLINHPILPSIK